MRGGGAKRSHRHLFWLIPIAVLLVGVLLSISSGVKGQTVLYVDPAGGTFKVGDEIEVTVKLKSQAEINAVEAKLKIVKGEDILQVVDINKSDSLIPLWISDPVFSVEEKLINFAGIVPVKGFKGEGKILSIKVKALKPGEVNIDFPSAAVLANDGQGTDVLKEKIGAKYTIIDSATPSPDLNNDGKVNISDISILISAWGKAGIENTRYDLNRDGKVDLLDLSILISKIILK